MYQHIIFDRDGTINDGSHYYVTKVEEITLLPKVKDTLTALNNKGVKLYIFTQQSCIGKGELTEEGLANIHNKMHELLGGDLFVDVVHCPHTEADACACRKPKTGMLDILAKKYQMTAENTLVVGDAERDYLAAKEKGFDFCLVKTGKGQDTANKIAQEVRFVTDDLEGLLDIYK